MKMKTTHRRATNMEATIKIVQRFGRKTIQLQLDSEMYKGYQYTGNKADDRKSLLALLGWASIDYSILAHEISIRDDLTDLLSD